ncbi:hypothetical protein BJX63DRAFT_443525 [Aspergillus granulosus]|uniref:Metallo-beta-lactamase domain-containing protein n=1 Tax=Aspergillus granulosus TaxID=176169 RepID=A0ABR4HA00_9EURO
MTPRLNATHIGTATDILEINGINFLTDPFFSPAGTSWDKGRIVLKTTRTTLTPSAASSSTAGTSSRGPDFGKGHDGLPNAIYFSGDTVYIEELDTIADRYHICAAVMNLGNAHAPVTDEPGAPLLQITMGGRDGAKLFRALKADVLVPMHYELWGYFTQFGEDIKRAFKEEGISEKSCWLRRDERVKVL